MDKKQISLICKALGDENRLLIVELLSSGKKCGCILLKELNITQPTLSHHMKVLCESGLVIGEKVGKWQHYQLNCEVFRAFKEYIKGLECCNGTKCGDLE